MPLATAMNGALDRLEAGYRLQREFSSDVAHELRTPLSILRMHSENLDDSNTAQSIRQSIKQMTRTIEQLMYTAEVESGRSFTSGDVNLVELAEQVIGEQIGRAHV